MCGVPDLRGRDRKSSWDAKPSEYKLDETQALYIHPKLSPNKVSINYERKTHRAVVVGAHPSTPEAEAGRSPYI